MDTVSIIGFILSVAALLGLGASIVYYARQARAAAQAQFQQSFIAISNAFMSYPKLRPLFHANGSPSGLSNDDEQRAETVAELLLDIFVLVIELEKRFRTKELAAGWKPYMDQMFAQSNFLRTHLGRRRDWYPTLAPLYASAQVTGTPGA